MKSLKVIVGWTVAAVLAIFYAATVVSWRLAKLLDPARDERDSIVLVAGFFVVSCFTAATVAVKTRGWVRIVLIPLLIMLSIVCILSPLEAQMNDWTFVTFLFACGAFYVAVLAVTTTGWKRLVLPPMLAIVWSLGTRQVLPQTSDVWWAGVTVLLATSFLVFVTATRTRGWFRMVLLPVQVFVSVLCVWQSFLSTWRFLPARSTAPGTDAASSFLYTPVLLVFFLLSVAAVANGLLRRFDCRGYIRACILALLAVAAVPLLMDDPPVPNDYTEKDVIATWPGADESRNVLLTYRRDGTNTLVVEIPAAGQWPPTNALVYADAISNAWTTIAKGREVIARLDSFDRIADMTRPEHVDMYASLVSFVSYRCISQTYWSYAKLRTEQGASREGAEVLVQLHSVIRKGLPEMVYAPTKMMFVAMANGSIYLAYLVASDPNCTPEVLEILRDGFPPLDRKALSLRRMFIGEYLRGNKYMTTATRPEGERILTDLVFSGREGHLSKLEIWVLRNCVRVGYRPNRTAHDYHRIVEMLIAADDATPPDFRQLDAHMKKFVASPQVNNPLGWRALSIGGASWDKASEQTFTTYITSQLLSIYLNKRLGKDVVMNDPFTGKPYMTDEKGVPFSVGRDGKPGTKDDVTLWIDPARPD